MDKSRILRVVFPILLVILVSYPTSPVLFQILASNYQTTIAICAFIILVCSVLFKSDTKSLKFNGCRRIIFYYCITNCAVCLLSSVFTRMTVGIRDALFIAALSSAALFLHRRVFIRIVENYAFLISVLIAVSTLSIGAFFLGLIERESCYVSLSIVNESNPVYTRQIGSDFTYYFPFFVCVIPIPNYVENLGFGIAFIRQPFIFTEPTYTWTYLAPVWFLVYSDKAFRNRTFCLSFLTLGLLLSFSVWGILSAGLILYILLIVKLRMIRQQRAAIVFVLTSIAAVVLNYELVLGIIGGGKIGQVDSLVERINLGAPLSLLGFASGDVESDESIGYGFGTVLMRYGVIGATVYLVWWIYLFCWSLRLFTDRRKQSCEFSPMLFFCSLTMSQLMALKIPQLGFLFSIIVLGYWDAKGNPGVNSLVNRSQKKTVHTWNNREAFASAKHGAWKTQNSTS